MDGHLARVIETFIPNRFQNVMRGFIIKLDERWNSYREEFVFILPFYEN